MSQKKSYLPIKVLISYLALAALVIGAGWILYTENQIFGKTENTIAAENNKVLKVGNLLSEIYQAESLSRLTIQSNNERDYKNYLAHTEVLQLKIDTVKSLIASSVQATLLDSVKNLLSKKTANIKNLRAIKSKASEEKTVKNAIDNITRMEGSLRKLKLHDFVKDPSTLKDYQRDILAKYVDYMNQNIPNDSTNTLSQKKLDSVLVASKKLLNNVNKQTAERRESLDSQEKNLLQNELSISAQLRSILNLVEQEIIANTAKTNTLKEASLRKTNKIVMLAAIVGFLLTVFFSLLILGDFSKSQSYKKQLIVANNKTESLLRNREQLISTVSHDLKTPLSTILGYTELLGNSALNDRQSYYTDNIRGSSDYIAKLVQDLVDFTQIEAGKITIEHIPFSLPELITETAKSINDVYPHKDIALQIEIEPAFEHKIVSDPFRLRQILSNLIGNAFKFTEKGFIAVTAKQNEVQKQLIISVTDSGIGIKESSHALIFEEFSQADDSIEKKYGGTGLGLTISRKMAEILGGNLTLKSVFGEGSTFEIRLPLEFDTSALTEKKAPGNLTDIDLNIIVIDDDNSLLQLTAEILRQKKYRVVTFNNAEDALAALATIDFDCIITDIQMTGMDGFSLLEKLKSNQGIYSGQPVIAVTGRADLENNVYREAGFTSVVKKPFTPKILLETVGEVLGTDVEIPVQEKPVAPNSAYSLSTLQSFIPEKKSLDEILSSFKKDTAKSLRILDTAVAENDRKTIEATAHRMSSMFLMLEADAIGSALKNLETETHSITEIVVIIEDLKRKIATLFLQLENDLLF